MRQKELWPQVVVLLTVSFKINIPDVLLSCQGHIRWRTSYHSHSTFPSFLFQSIYFPLLSSCALWRALLICLYIEITKLPHADPSHLFLHRDPVRYKGDHHNRIIHKHWKYSGTHRVTLIFASLNTFERGIKCATFIKWQNISVCVWQVELGRKMQRYMYICHIHSAQFVHRATLLMNQIHYYLITNIVQEITMKCVSAK